MFLKFWLLRVEVIQLVEHLYCIHEALGSIPSARVWGIVSLKIHEAKVDRTKGEAENISSLVG